MISKKAKMIEKAISRIGFRSMTAKMMLHPKRDGKFTEPPKSFHKKYNVTSFISHNSKCVSVKANNKPQLHIVYFHGGAYTVQASIPHWKTADYLLTNTECELTFVNYPLAPEHTCAECIDAVKKIYSDVFKGSNQEIILMGDSAGGGLALALAQVINAENIMPKPKKIVLLSPWLDVSMEEGTLEKQEDDLILDKHTLKTIGQMYAGNLDTKHHFCSPLYGDFADLGEIALFTGTKDILNVQANKLCDKLSKKDGLSCYEYEGMQHVWMMLPIPEAAKAMEEVTDFINRK